MVRRRAKAAGIKAPIGCHTFRATGIAAYLENGGTLEHAQAMACAREPLWIHPADDALLLSPDFAPSGAGTG
jgi:integrase